MKTKKRVRFHIFNEIQYIPKDKDKTLWYSEIDYSKFKTDMVREISLFRLFSKTF